MLVFWLVMTSGLAGRYQRFRVTYCLRLQPWRWRQYDPQEYCHLPTNTHSVTKQKTTLTPPLLWDSHISYLIIKFLKMFQILSSEQSHCSNRASCWLSVCGKRQRRCARMNTHSKKHQLLRYHHIYSYVRVRDVSLIGAVIMDGEVHQGQRNRVN
jgi:hypothetical protein